MNIPILRDWLHLPPIAPVPAIAYSITCNGKHTGIVHTDYDETVERLQDLNKRYPAERRKIVPLVAAS